MNSRPPRIAVVAAAFVIAAACALVVVLVRHGTGGHVPPAGRCEVSSTRALTPDTAERVVGVVHHRGSFWALAVRGQGASREARLLRSASGREAPPPVATSTLAATSSLAGPVVTQGGVAFVAAAGPVIRATTFDGRAARSVELPRGEAPPGRDALTPRLSLATEGDGTLSVAAHWGDRFGTRRLHARDTRESPGLGPLRRDRFDAPALAVMGGSVVAVHRRRVGTFTDDSITRHTLEAVALPSTPFDVTPPRDALVATAVGLDSPRLAAVEGSAVALWGDGQHLRAARIGVSATAVSVGASIELDLEFEEHYALAAGSGPCAVALWSRHDRVDVRGLRADGTALVATPVTSIAAAAVDGVRLARSGAGLVALVSANHALRAWRIDLDAACAPTLGALALPAGVGAGLRVIALDGDATGATLLMTQDPPDAASTRVTRVEIDPTFRVSAPVAEVVPQPVTEGARFTTQTALVAGPYRETVRLQRIGDAAEDDEPGEDLLLRQARGRDFAIIASATLHRIWVADRADERSNPFHPPHAVVLHSAIDTLEDGPRTETATAAPPEAAFATADLHRYDEADPARPAWALVTAPDPASPGLDGPWAFLFGRGDEPLARTANDGSPFPNGAPLLPPALRSPRDRVSPVAWRGATLAAVVSGPRAGVRLVTGDPFSGSLRDVPLCDTPASMVRGATVMPHGDGWIAFWLDVTHPQPTLRDRRYDVSGVPRGEPETLGEFLHLDEASLPASLVSTVAGPDEFAVAVPTPHGARLAEVRCAR